MVVTLRPGMIIHRTPKRGDVIGDTVGVGTEWVVVEEPDNTLYKHSVRAQVTVSVGQVWELGEFCRFQTEWDVEHMEEIGFVLGPVTPAPKGSDGWW